MLEISRRTLLKLSLATGLVVGLLVGVKEFLVPKGEPDPRLATLRAYVDTLIPADEAPGAVELGVADGMLADTVPESTYDRLLLEGCAWLDEQAKARGARSFTKLAEGLREEVVALASAAERNSLAYVFFAATRDAAFSRYYADPRSWRALRYAGPPQPHGFTDYASAPMHPDER